MHAKYMGLDFIAPSRLEYHIRELPNYIQMMGLVIKINVKNQILYFFLKIQY